MYVYAQDPFTRAMVGILSTRPPFHEDIDNGEMVASILRQQTTAPSSDARGVFILVLEEKYPNPNAAWRKRYSDLKNEVRFKDFWFAVVTPSALARGALTAIGWLRPRSPHFHTEAFATFDEAARWAGEPKPALLHRLYSEAQSARRTGGS